LSQAILSNEIDWDAPELQPLSSSARDFLERLLQRNPVLRPSAAEALEHEWLAVEGAANDMPLKVKCCRNCEQCILVHAYVR
jgi:calcium-dependent protein kinase